MTDFTLSVFSEINQRSTSYIESHIDAARASTITSTSIDTNKLPFFIKKYVGKVRDLYICKDYVIMVTTDRQSAFDRQLSSVPFKGQVLNLTSNYWFNITKHFVPNHVLSSPHPNVTIGKKCEIFPIEFVMRGYITGSTSTSMWTNYAKGVRNYCGHILADGLIKNSKLSENKLTPTTKDDIHDELISAEDILSRNIMSPEDWEVCSNYAHRLFEFSQQVAASKGLILVDTKYEFGKDSDGNIVLVDEIQTPDSSRYWVQQTYEARMAANE
eukprot:gene17445-24129_t